VLDDLSGTHKLRSVVISASDSTLRTYWLFSLRKTSKHSNDYRIQSTQRVKLLNTNNMDIIQNNCQQYFDIELPSNRWAKRVDRFEKACWELQ